MDPRDLPRAPHGRHYHICQCGDYYVCSQRDGCDEVWECPHCEMEMRDRDVQAREQQMLPTAAEKGVA